MSARGPNAETIARRQSKRAKTGRTFQDSLNITHRIYAGRKVGWIREHAIKTVWVSDARGRVATRGANPPDFQGGVWLNENGIATRTLVAFDAKVKDEAAASFTYPPKQTHQLLDMLELHETGLGLGFVLILERKYDLAYLIWRPTHLKALWAGATVLLRELAKDGLSLTSDFLIVPRSGAGFDWREALNDRHRARSTIPLLGRIRHERQNPPLPSTP